MPHNLTTLLESGEMPELILANVLDYAVFVMDVNGVIVRCYPGVEVLLGYTAEAFVGQHFRLIFSEADVQAQMPEHEMQVAATQGQALDERWHKKADGSLFFAYGTLTALRDAQGVLLGYAKILRDATDKQAQKFALEASQQRLHSVIDSLFAFVALTTPDGLMLEVNKPALDAAGLTKQEVIGEYFYELYYWTHTAETQQRIRQACVNACNGQSQRFDVPARISDDSFITVDFMIVPVFDEQGKVRYLVPSGMDVTQRRHDEAALIESEIRFRSTFENAAVGIAHVGVDGSWLRVNKRLCDIVGYSKAELIKRKFQDITYPDDLEPDFTKFEQLMKGDINDYEMDKRYVRKDSSVVWVHLTTSLQRDEHNNPLYCIAVVEDITARKNAEAALASLNQELEARVHQRTQEVRALASQLTLAESKEQARLAQLLHDDLQQQLYGAQFALRNTRKALQSGQNTEQELEYAQQFLKNALQIARSITANLSPPVLAGEGLIEALSWLGSDMQLQHGLHVRIEADASPVIPSESVQVLLFNLVRELLFNVVKHAQVSQATVALTQSTEDLTISVMDNGQGFNPEQHQGALKKGTGLGLSGVRKRLQLFGGSLHVTSAPGEGTRVTIIMPTSSLSIP